MIIIFTLLIFILWIVVQIASIFTIVKEMGKANWKKWINIIIAFLKTRAERKVFYSFMATEVC